MEGEFHHPDSQTEKRPAFLQGYMDFSYKFPSISCAGQLLPLTFIYTAKKHHAKKIGRKTEYIYLVYFRSNSLSLKKKEKSYIHFKSSASEQKVGEVHSLCKILVQEDSD